MLSSWRAGPACTLTCTWIAWGLRLVASRSGHNGTTRTATKPIHHTLDDRIDGLRRQKQRAGGPRHFQIWIHDHEGPCAVVSCHTATPFATAGSTLG